MVRPTHLRGVGRAQAVAAPIVEGKSAPWRGPSGLRQSQWDARGARGVSRACRHSFIRSDAPLVPKRGPAEGGSAWGRLRPHDLRPPPSALICDFKGHLVRLQARLSTGKAGNYGGWGRREAGLGALPRRERPRKKTKSRVASPGTNTNPPCILGILGGSALSRLYWRSVGGSPRSGRSLEGRSPGNLPGNLPLRARSWSELGASGAAFREDRSGKIAPGAASFARNRPLNGTVERGPRLHDPSFDCLLTAPSVGGFILRRAAEGHRDLDARNPPIKLCKFGQCSSKSE